MMIWQRVLLTMERHGMMERGDTVVVAVSGGADSMALLHLLASLREERRLSLHVAHLNHGLRPDAEQDAQFVGEVARGLSVPVTLAAVDVRAIAARDRRSIEDAGRRARYAFFRDLAAGVGARRIATAHTRDDQVETVLMRLLQGGTWEMLAGIPAVRGLDAAVVVRPLREVARQEITQYLEAQGLRWRDDPTNRDLRQLRNRVRHVVLPALARAYPGAIDRLWELGEAARDAAAVMNRLAGAVHGHLPSREAGAVCYPRGAFAGLPAALQRRLLVMAIAEVAGTAQAPSLVVLEQAVRAAAGRVGSETPVGDAVLHVGYETVEIARPRPAPPDLAYRLEVPGEVRAEGFGLVFAAEILAASPAARAPGPHEAWFDAACAQVPLVIRSWRRGDRFSPWGMGGGKKLQDFFVDAKVPRRHRRAVPLVADAGGRILWVVGYRVSEACRLTDRTHSVLRVRAGPA